jgi:hypothetical protein
MPPALLQPPHQPRSRLLARAPGLGGAPFLARAPVLGGTRPVVPVMRRELVTAHMLQASMTTKPATAIRIDIDHDPGEQQPDADQEPERRLGAPALVAHPRVGRVDGAGKPRVVGTKRLLDLLELAPLAQLGVPARPGTQAAQQAHLPLPHIQLQRTKQAHEPLAGSSHQPRPSRGRLPGQPSRSRATGVTLHGGCPRRAECPYRPNGRFPAQARSAGCHA